MSHARLAAVNWLRPWLAEWPAPQLWGDALHSVAECLNEHGAAPVRFVPHACLPAEQAYEQFIFDTGTVPTRDNLHDLFNGLCWTRFPLTKARLNELQAEQLAASGVQGLRGPVRDALTVFDENAAFLQAPPLLWEALVARDWQQLFITLRPLWGQATLTLFGHALLEKLVSPRKAITAHVFAVPVATDIGAKRGALDAFVAARLSADVLRRKPFVPLPVLGVPGWWAENEDFSFYDDSAVFRPRSAHHSFELCGKTR